MADKRQFGVALQAARALIAQGRLAEARAALEALQGDAEIGLLGQPTVLGLPRRLQSVLLKLAKAEGDPVRRIGYQFALVPPPEVLARHGRIDDAERARMALAGRAEVPRLIHQIWIGPLPPPVTAAAWRDHAARQGYDYRLWREADLAGIGADRHPSYAAMIARGDLAGATDVARYAVLHGSGGIYLDCDWYPARDDIGFHHRLPLVGLTAIAEPIPRQTGAGSVLLSNAFIAAPKAHPALARLLAILPEVVEALPGAPAWWATGPLPFTIVTRAAAVTIADHALIAGQAPAGAGLAEVRALCTRLAAEGGGLLLAWKPWAAG
ncbi:MAG: mannosyltransferase [Proteobacteria bacterium]|nr:mannosyltransferase [Pseudomonadota bacterium]MBS0572112.1 mannosyltransferase [Pseudomonadota bacterium]